VLRSARAATSRRAARSAVPGEGPLGARRDGYLGRVVDALATRSTARAPIESSERRLLEVQAASVVERQPVKEPMLTGIKGCRTP